MRIITKLLACLLAGVFTSTPIAIATHSSPRSASTPVVAAHAVRTGGSAASRSYVRPALDDQAELAQLKRHQAIAERRAAIAHAKHLAAIRERRRLQLIYSSSAAWAHQPFSIAVANCESGPGPSGAWVGHYIGNPHLMDPNGHDGKWQFAPSTARSVGAPGAAIAYLSEAAQDCFAWKLWKRDGWAPWECAHLV